jgi:hypothetical protein
VETLLRLPNQGKKEPMILLGIYPTEWDLPRQGREKLTMLVGLSAVEWEKRPHEERERGGASQAVAVYCLRYCDCPWPAGTASAGWPSGRFPCCKSPALVAGLASTLARLQSGDQGGRFLRLPRELVGLAAICAGGRRPAGYSTSKTV